MPIDDVLSQTTDIDQRRRQQKKQQNGGEQALETYPNQASVALSGDANQLANQTAQSLGPVIQFEKTDIQFWADVATLVLLFLIWRKL